MSKVAITGNASGAGVFTIASPDSATDRTLTLPDETGTIALAQSLSYIRLNTTNGHGSTNTTIRRFTNVVNNVGSDMTYADSATLGMSVTINTDGIYSVSHSGTFSVGGWVGVSINSSQLTTNIVSISVSDVLTVTYSEAGLGRVASATFYAPASSIIRAHTGGQGNDTPINSSQFTIARVA